MADFDVAFRQTMKVEGGYANDPKDPGGETHAGISRRWHPKIPVWALIDSYKSKPDFPNSLRHDRVLSGMVKDFYETEFWDRCHGDEIQSQGIADELFDTAVNSDVPDAVVILQRSLNALNRAQSLYPNIEVDGRMGPLTVDTVTAYLAKDSEELILVVMNGLQLAKFIRIMEHNEVMERFARGWILNRIKIGRS